MEIRLENIAKRYNYQIIFKGINYTFEANKKYAILGANGSGKSTLLKILSGFLSPSQGKISFYYHGVEIKIEKVFSEVNYSAPYIQLPEKLTLKELFDFHSTFKNLKTGIAKNSFFEILNLKNIENKFVSDYSSGMKQRVKLALTFLFESKYILLDEPLSNLDEQGIDWYNKLITNYLDNRLLIVASNDKKEYSFCDEVLNIENYK